MVGVEQWAEIRRLHFVRGLSMREIHRRTGLHRDTISRAIHSDVPPAYRRAPSGSKLDPFKDEIHRLLKEDPKLPGQRVRELIAPLGFGGGKTIVDDYLRDDSRDSHGGQARIKAARFAARKTLEEFDFAFQASVPRNQVLHLGQLDFLAGRENVVLLGPPDRGS